MHQLQRSRRARRAAIFSGLSIKLNLSKVNLSLILNWRWLVVFCLLVLSSHAYGQPTDKLRFSGVDSALTRALLLKSLKQQTAIFEQITISAEALGYIEFTLARPFDLQLLISQLSSNSLLEFRPAEQQATDFLEIVIVPSNSRIFNQQLWLNNVPREKIIALLPAEEATIAKIYEELEANNSPYTANRVNYDQEVVGELSSRGDKDFFLISSDRQLERWNFEILTLAETSFSPVAFFYDGSLQKIAEFDLRQQTKLSFSLLEPSSYVYLRIADEIGRMQFEAGKILTYFYHFIAQDFTPALAE